MAHTREMPQIDIDRIADLTSQERQIVEHITTRGHLRASKPPMDYHVETGEYGWKVKVASELTGYSAYVWRMVAFFASPNPRHHCMPCTADFDIPGKWSEKQPIVKALDNLVSRIVDTIPARQQHGVVRWGEALGMIGTPRYNAEGAVIYRLDD